MTFLEFTSSSSNDKNLVKVHKRVLKNQEISRKKKQELND